MTDDECGAGLIGVGGLWWACFGWRLRWAAIDVVGRVGIDSAQDMVTF